MMRWLPVFFLLVALGWASCSSSTPKPQADPIRQVNNNGVRISYRVYGQGKPLVLIHGWPSEGRFWEEFGYVSKLSPDYQLIVPDMRGFGKSSVPADGNFSDEAHASDIRAVMDDMGIRSAHIFGFSVGGMVAYELAASSPDRVRSLVVLGVHPYAENLQRTRDTWSTAEANLRFWEDAKAPLSAESKQRLAAFTPEQLRALLPDRDDKSERLKAWHGPTLLMAGTKDGRIESIKRFAASNSKWRFVPIEGVSHGQSWMEVERVVPALQDFLRHSAGP